MEQAISRYQQLQERRQQALLRKAELEATLKHKKEEYDKLNKQLQEEYGVKTIQEAYELRDRLQSELNKELDELETALQKYENTGDSL